MTKQKAVGGESTYIIQFARTTEISLSGHGRHGFARKIQSLSERRCSTGREIYREVKAIARRIIGLSLSPLHDSGHKLAKGKNGPRAKIPSAKFVTTITAKRLLDSFSPML